MRKSIITTIIVVAMTIVMGMTAFAANECTDYNIKTNLARTYGEISFQTPATWGEPTTANGAFIWSLPEGYVTVSYNSLAGINPLVITNDEITTIPLTNMAAMSLAATNIQLGLLPADSRNTCFITGTGTVNGIPGTLTYAIVNSSTGVYSFQYFAGTVAGISRLNDFTQVVNSISFGTQSTATTSNTTTASGTSKSNSNWDAYQAQKQADYAQYQAEKEANYQANRNKSYAERRADYDRVYKENLQRRDATYDKYH